MQLAWTQSFSKYVSQREMRRKPGLQTQVSRKRLIGKRPPEKLICSPQSTKQIFYHKKPTAIFVGATPAMASRTNTLMTRIARTGWNMVNTSPAKATPSLWARLTNEKY